MSLSALAHKYGTDKYPGYRGRGGNDYHSYVPFYEQLFHGRKVTSLLEIGIDTGASLRMWRDYFPGADIWGIDIRSECRFSEPDIYTAILHAGDPDSLRQFVGRARFDIIIDDGSHQLADQIVSAKVLIPTLRKGAVYVIEDINSKDVPAIREALPAIRIVEFETWRKDDDILGVIEL